MEAHSSLARCFPFTSQAPDRPGVAPPTVVQFTPVINQENRPTGLPPGSLTEAVFSFVGPPPRCVWVCVKLKETNQLRAELVS